MRALPLLPLLAACGAAQTSLPSPVELEVADGSLRLVLLGDTGTADEDGGGVCAPDTTAAVLPAACRAELLASVAAEAADAVLDLGDLVYEAGPLCRGGLGASQRELLDERLGRFDDALDAPLLLVLGNHDVHQSRAGREDAERCYRLWAAERPDVHLPERNYVVRAGPALILALDTNRALGPELAEALAAAVDASTAPWTLFAGHHVWRTYEDKVGEEDGPRFAAAIGRSPDFWLNGHAHFLQFGVYDGVAAVTSGSAGKLRGSADCAGEACAEPGRLFGAQRYGYAVLDLSADEAVLVFKDVRGAELYRWSRSR